MAEIIKASLIFRFVFSLCEKIGNQWKKSKIIKAFLNMKDEDALIGASVFGKIGFRLRNILSTIFAMLRLDKLFEGSLSVKPFLWMLPAIVLAPIVPTMVLFGLVSAGAVSTFIQLAIHRDRVLEGAPVNRYVLLYAVMYTIATFMSVSVSGSFFPGLLTTVFVLSVFFVENSIDSGYKLKAVIFLMVCAGVTVSLYGFYQYLFGAAGSNAWVDEEMFSGIGIRVYSTLQNPNVLSEYLLLIIPLSAACFFSADNWLKRIFYFCTSGIMCVCMLLTFSRAGWLGIIFAAVIFLILLDRKFIILILLGMLAVVATAPDVIVERFVSIGNMSDGSTSYRVAIWLGTVAMLKDYWLTGIGPGTQAFNDVYPAYSFNTATAQHSHNLFLQLFCDGGLCLFVIFVLMIIVFSRMMCTAISRETNRTARIFQISSLSSIGGFLVQSMADHSFYNYRVMFLFWMFIGLGTVFRRMGRYSHELTGCEILSGRKRS